MTGEITPWGEVLAIGGLKEKLLAAVRGGSKTALIPEENVKDLTEIPDNIKNKIEIVPVKWIDQVLERALEHLPEALPEAAPDGASGASGDPRPLLLRRLPIDFGWADADEYSAPARPLACRKEAGKPRKPLDTKISAAL